MPFRTAKYSLSYRFSREWGSPFSCTTVCIGFDTPKRWITLSFDCITEPQDEPSSRIGSLLWRFKGKRQV